MKGVSNSVLTNIENLFFMVQRLCFYSLRILLRRLPGETFPWDRQAGLASLFKKRRIMRDIFSLSTRDITKQYQLIL